MVTIQWNSPYTEPPEGRRIIWAACELHSGPTCYYANVPRPPGYGLHYTWMTINTPKLMSPEKLLQRRLKNLKRRTSKIISFPALRDAVIRETMRDQPERYSLAGCQEDQDKKRQHFLNHRDEITDEIRRSLRRCDLEPVAP